MTHRRGQAAHRFVGVGGLLVTISCQPVPMESRHEVQMAVSDAEASAQWYTRNVGFRLDEYVTGANGRATARLSLGEARLTLEQTGDRAPGPTNVIKVGLLVPNLAEASRRLQESAPEALLVPMADLPPGPDGVAWPTAHVLARDPNGTLVQLFGREARTPSASWMLAAVTVPHLDAAVGWYADAAGFGEVMRPPQGDPRSLLRRGDFYLEIGEFGNPPDAGARTGVTALQLDAGRTDCASLDTPQAFRISRCGTAR